MNVRVKFEVWSPTQKRWKTCYCLWGKLAANRKLMREYDIAHRIVL